MKKLLILLSLVLVIATSSWAQLTGQKYIPGSSGLNDYSSIAIAIADLNSQGVGIGGVTFNIASGYTETITSPLSITATGTLANQIIFQKDGSGSNPLITAYTGVETPTSAIQDGMWNLIGSDYVTINGIDLYDPNSTNPSTMEYGFGMFKQDETNGCQYNTIINCIVSLSRENNASGNTIAVDGSRAINVVNALFTNQTTVLTPTQISGTNSYNKFYSNTLKNCNYGFALIGFAGASPFTLCDFGNDIGGISPETGNTILNFGGVGGDTTTAGLPNPSAAVRTLAQYDINVSYNTINNNDGTGKNHKSTLRGIYLNTAVSANANITNNTLTIKSWVKTNQVSVIENVSGATATSNTIRISNNTITNCENDSTSTGVWYGIYNNAASPSNLIINNNIFTTNTTKVLSGATNIIYNNGAVKTVDSICGNSFSFSHTGSTAYSGTNYGLYNNGGATTCNVVINNNNFSNYSYTTTSTSNNLYFINLAASAYNLNISNNTWTNLSLNHTGTENLCSVSTAVNGTSLNVTNNFIAGSYTRTAATGGFNGINITGTTTIGTLVTLSDNDLSNITASTTGTGAFNGIIESSSAVSPYSLKSIHNNVVSTINYNSTGAFNGLLVNYCGAGFTISGSRIFDNTITGITTAGNINGLNLSSTSSISYRNMVYNNTVNTITSSGASSTICAVSLASGGAGIDFYKHNIFDIKATGATAFAYGIIIPNSGSNTNIYNNYISDIKSINTSSTTDGVRGISITTAVSVSNINLYYNTIYLDATSTGANFSSSAVYHNYNAIDYALKLNMQNNILANNSIPKGTGITSTFRRSASGIGNLSSNCNYNCFYTDTTLANHFIYSYTTGTYKSMQDYKGYVADRDIQSFTELPVFSNIATKPYDLHLSLVSPLTPTQCESGGIQIPGISIDNDDESRFGDPAYTGTGMSTDVGADEGEFMLSTDIIAPAIVFTPILNTGYPTSTIIATITDPSGVPSTIGDLGLPVLNWKINVPGSWNSVTASPLGNNQYSFTFGSGALSGDSILYYIVAQDGAANVGTFPYLGSAGFGLNPPSVSTPPTTLSKFKQLASLSGNYTIDSSMATGGTNFKTFTDAVSALNAAGIIAPVIFNVTANQSWNNTCSGSPSIALKITNKTTTPTNTVTFVKAGTGKNPVINIKGTSGTSDNGIYLEDVKYFTFDGIDVIDSGSSASNYFEYGVYLKGINIGCQYNTFKNMEINMERSVSSYGIYSSSAAFSFATANSYNKFYNNIVRECRTGYYFSGKVTYNDMMNEIGNEYSGFSAILSNGSPSVASSAFGISGTYQNGMRVFNTLIDSLITLAGVCDGIDLQYGSNLSIYGNTIRNLYQGSGGGNNSIYFMNISSTNDGTINIYNNNLYNATIPATNSNGGLYGFRLYQGTTNWNVYGNNIYNLTNNKALNTGIYIALGTGSFANVYNNKMHQFSSISATGNSIAIYGDQAATTFNIHNNYIYDIKNTASNGTSFTNYPVLATQGLAAINGNYKIYYNTVYLDYTSTNALNTSSALFVNSATPVVDIRNNIFVNKCDMTNGAFATAFMYNSKSNYTNIASTSDNNLFYSGIPSVKNLIFCDSLVPTSTNNFIQLLADYKTLSGKDANSVTENPPFMSTVAPYNLHINNTLPTITSNNGQVITGYDNDFDAEIRFGSIGYTGNSATGTDIGADEFDADLHKTLNLSLYLEGLFSGTGMNEVADELGVHWGAGIADKITVELHNATTPAIVETSFNEKILHTNGSCSFDIPYNLGDSYYVVIKHRNSIQTWSAAPVSFATPTINYNFTTAATTAFGNNLKEVGIGIYAIYVGDVNQDEVIDLSDLVSMDTDLTNGTVAYIVYDLNGDGVVDLSDLVAIDENLTNGVVVMYP